MKKILVGIDGSEREKDVMDVAIVLAEGLDARVHLVRAVGRPLQQLPWGMLSISPDDLERAMLEEAEKEVEIAMLSIPQPLRGNARAVVGAAPFVIEEMARAADVDVIVIGSHGHGMIDKILGSTAAKIVNHSERSVFVVRAARRLLTES